MHADRRRRGIALIDVLVSIVILGASGTALVTLLGQTAMTMRALERADRESLNASRELNWLDALSRTELLARIGRIRRHGWTVDVSESTTGLFDVTIAASDTSPPVLATTFYRPDTTHALR